MSTIGRSKSNAGLSGHTPSGFTLIEVAVTLVVMALVVTLVIPTFSKQTVSHASVADVVRNTSRLALRRAEWITLRVDARGGWDVHSDTQQDTTSLAFGALVASESMPFVIRLSPMGACLTNDVSVTDPCVAVTRSVGASETRRTPRE